MIDEQDDWFGEIDWAQIETAALAAKSDTSAVKVDNGKGRREKERSQRSISSSTPRRIDSDSISSQSVLRGAAVKTASQTTCESEDLADSYEQPEPLCPDGISVSSSKTIFSQDSFYELVRTYTENASANKMDQFRLACFLRNIVTKLKRYQMEGVAWALRHDCRAMIYDEMGLGKTIQGLTCMIIHCLSKATWPAIIVCPGSLRMTWKNEMEKWIPFLDPDEICVIQNSRFTLLPNTKVIITSYRMIEYVVPALGSITPKFIIADEAQKTRTFNSQMSFGLVNLCRNVNHIILLSGTPMLIRPFEIFTQLDILLPVQDKCALMDLWGSYRDCSRDGLSLDLKRSHLGRVLLDPIRCFKDLLRYLHVKEESWMGIVAEAVKEFSSIRNSTESTAQSTSPTKSLLEQVWAKLHDPLLQHKLLGVYADFLLEIYEIVQANLRHLDREERKTYLKNLRQDLTVKRPLSLGIADFRRTVAQMSRTWFLLFVNPPVQSLSETIVRMWDAHRFGVEFCAGTKRERFGGGRGLVWSYTGSSRANLARLRRTVAKYAIRRKKSEVLADLPPKRRGLVLVALENNLNDSNSSREGKRSPQQSNCAGLELGQYRGEVQSFALRSQILPSDLVWELHKLGMAKAPYVAERVIEILNDLPEKEKVLVFAHHIPVLNTIHGHLVQKRGSNQAHPNFQRYHSAIITGQTPIPDRDKIVQSFQYDDTLGPRVLILSMLAMGTGFTLTRGSVVVMAELHWSPQILLQAEDRAHRIGQKDSVIIHYILAQNSFDMRLWPALSARLGAMEETIKKSNSTVDKEGNESKARVHAYNVALCNWLDQRFGEFSRQVSIFFEKFVNGSSLRYKVSESTRIHLHLQLDENSRALWDELCVKHGLISAVELPETIPLNENFGLGDFKAFADEQIQRAEESFDSNTGNLTPMSMIPRTLQDPSKTAFSSTEAFVEEWINLTQAKRNKILGLKKLLTVPLSKYLETLHETERISSFERTCNSTFQMHQSAISNYGSGNYKVAYVRFLQPNLNKQSSGHSCLQQAFHFYSGEPLCIFCGALYDSKHRYQTLDSIDGIETNQLPTILIQGTAQALFCQGAAPCFTSWTIKCFHNVARILLAENDAGICANCKVDTKSMMLRARPFPPNSLARQEQLFCPQCAERSSSPDILCQHWTIGSVYSSAISKTRMHWSHLQKLILGEKWLKQILNSKHLSEGLFWEADHKVAVRLGGGGAILDNFQTLCKPCHLSKTKEDRRRISQLKKRQKKHSDATQKRQKIWDPKNLVCEWCDFHASTIPVRIRHDLVCPFKPVVDKDY